MAELQATVTIAAQPPASAAPAAPAAPESGTTFAELLSDLNPLQHIPLVGTLYRAITGEQISEPARLAGSLVFGGLTGGPVGLATSLASSVLQKLTGIDADALGQQVLASIGIGHGGQGGPPAPAEPATTADAAQASTATASAKSVDGASAAAARPWSAAQLAALGVTTDGGTLRRGALEGADALNAVELDRLRDINAAVAAYHRQAATPAA